jgi:hypothetical protein
MNKSLLNIQATNRAREFEGAACWSCLAINEQGTQICSLCGADQTHPVPIAATTPRGARAQDWWSVMLVILAGIGCLSGILWHNLGAPTPDAHSAMAEVIAQSLRGVRDELSNYMLSHATYPISLESMNDQVDNLLKSAERADYKIFYVPNPASHNGPLGFEIIARPNRSDYINLYVDESGIVRTTRENRPATKQDPQL